MPCFTDPPSAHEEAEKALNELLDEIGDKGKRTSRGNIYGAMRSLDIQEMTRILCAWCKKNDVKRKSLEFQIWWRDHQIEDEKHAKAVEREKERRAANAKEEQRRWRLRDSARAKLTKEERRVLGL